jgi:hypothetical protein
MNLFIKEKQPPFGIRTSLENFGKLPCIKIVPLYALNGFIA